MSKSLNGSFTTAQTFELRLADLIITSHTSTQRNKYVFNNHSSVIIVREFRR